MASFTLLTMCFTGNKNANKIKAVEIFVNLLVSVNRSNGFQDFESASANVLLQKYQHNYINIQ